MCVGIENKCLSVKARWNELVWTLDNCQCCRQRIHVCRSGSSSISRRQLCYCLVTSDDLSWRRCEMTSRKKVPVSSFGHVLSTHSRGASALQILPNSAIQFRNSRRRRPPSWIFSFCEFGHSGVLIVCYLTFSEKQDGGRSSSSSSSRVFV